VTLELTVEEAQLIMGVSGEVLAPDNLSYNIYKALKNAKVKSPSKFRPIDTIRLQEGC